MAKTVTTTIRLDEELKKELTHDLDIMRLNINAYFTMAAKQLVLKKKYLLKFQHLVMIFLMRQQEKQ